MKINIELLTLLVKSFIAQSIAEYVFESQSVSIGSFEAKGYVWQLQLTVTRNEDDFLPDIVGQDIFKD